ncbi:MAG: phytanoyl-CoA dioxygenase, partial [Gemmatimonadetes bacterium]|nr:phytanoyl-CoA dioxygenase family protein [Gemmatimonadota bacterium]NIU78982.1 phytanoyl-CoA dioxygenase [Gammaproteobacteria bacterium]NIQ58811.1 phytanoyl-CoA dioxygenase family protein [Gemmatimonadota bacterium]NIW35911.1 phytanoyl-CoA dioxygenase [Gemmatimonadota bacterium]NIX47731.1 phytanoyl-CoA dioxygenase [Gemmatimonadota bacterium]
MTTRPPRLDAPYPLSDDHIAAYERDGFIKLKDGIPADVLERYAREITDRVLEIAPGDAPLEERDTYGRAFLQVTNLWRRSEPVKELVLGERLGRIAAELMRVDGTRLYHDQALYKEPGGGFTPWHADQYYWPLATDRCITAWIPLQPTPVEMGALAFAVGSQYVEIGRDIPISDESETLLQEELERAGLEYSVTPYDLGEVSFHSGWTFHRAGPNRTDAPRRVMTVIYMDRDMRLAEPGNDHQVAD